VAGFEALVRWGSPEARTHGAGRNSSPSRKRPGLIIDLGMFRASDQTAKQALDLAGARCAFARADLRQRQPSPSRQLFAPMT